MKSPLIKKTSFRDLLDEVVLKTQILKRKNDQYQRLSIDSLDSGMVQEIRDEKNLVDRELA